VPIAPTAGFIDAQIHCTGELTVKMGMDVYWNTTTKTARAWLRFCAAGWTYDADTDVFNDKARAWFDGTAERLFDTYLSPNRTG